MKLPPFVVDVRIAISFDHDMVVHVIPNASTRHKPYCSYVPMSGLPADVMAYIDQIERAARKAEQ